MKKFLTVLLALSVVFTYTFGTAGSVFAVTADGKYTSADYSEYLNKQWDDYYSKQLSIVEQDYVKALALSGETVLYNTVLYNTVVKASDLGLKATNGGSIPWTDKATEAYQKLIQEDINTAKAKYISTTIEAVFKVDSAVTTAPADSRYNDIGDAVVYSEKNITIKNIVDDYTNNAINVNVAKFKAAQAESLYTAVTAAINAVAEDNYSTDNANAIAGLKENAIKAVEAIKNDGTADTTKAKAYVEAFAGFKAEADKIPTKDKEDLDDTDAAATIASAVAKYVNYALDKTYTVFKLTAGAPVPAAYEAVTGIDKNVYEKGANKTATIFGVAIANTDKVTAAEAAAVNKAYHEAVVASADVVTAYANALENKTVAEKVAAVGSLYSNNYECLRTINKAMNAADVYADVVAEGDAMKAATKYGIKMYDDAKVDAAVKEAETLVYADLKAGFKTAVEYINDAAAKLGYDDLYATNFEYKAFKNAIAAAKAKFYKADGTPQVKVLYGDNKTDEADYVYLKSTYASVEADTWTAIADSVCNKLDIAESYAEIDEIMDDAAAQMSELMLAKDELTVRAAIDSHKKALADSLAEAKKIMGTTDYLEASFQEAYEDGLDLIEAADTLDEVKAAYAQSESLIRNIPTKAELQAAEKALIEKINALPSTSDLTAADKNTVVSVLNDYMAYAAMYGADKAKITNTYTLNADLDAVLRAVYKDLNTRVQDTIKVVEKQNPNTDNGAATLVSLKDDIIALIDEAESFNGLLVDADSVLSNNEYYANQLTIDVTALEATLNAENAIWTAEVHNLLAAANTADTIAEKKAVIEAYDKLTDRQQYKLEQNLKTLINAIKNDIIAAVESLKITASSTAAKGSITVKWKVVGDYEAADGMRVYKSTKMNSGYGATPYFITKAGATQYKNTKELKKGTRYYYKVRAYVEIDGVKYYSDYSNKAYRIAK